MLVLKSVANMRKEPLDGSEVVSQALFAENITVLRESEDWSLIKTPDGYSGWVRSIYISKVPEGYETSLKVSCMAALLYANKDIKRGPVLTLPYGVSLKVIDDLDPDWFKVKLPKGDFYYVRKGVLAPSATLSIDQIVSFSKRFLYLPYIWGGRSSFGFDCSGFIQMLYAQMGILLPRDSDPQSKDPRFISINQEDLSEGDLIFWGQSSEKIQHVGLYIGRAQFIHASTKESKPWVRISDLSDTVWNGGVYPYRDFKTLR